jgi:5-methyltetrahydrofolate--homocysteine methyltransferase
LEEQEMSSKLIIVGENIHCTRIFKVGGLFVKNIDGRDVILYGKKGEKNELPVPSEFTGSEDWSNGKVKHAAVGIWQGLHGGSEEERRAGSDYIRYMAQKQEKAAATFLDVNVDEFGDEVDERIEAIKWTAEAIQDAVSIPLSIDSSNVAILEAGLAACDKSRGKPMVNSVSLEREDAIGVAAEAGAVVVAGAASKSGMPDSKEDRIVNIAQLMSLLRDAGFSEPDVHLDPLVFPISVNPKNGTNIIEAVRDLREEYGAQIHFAPGLSNISFGMPNRKLLNQVFVHLCREAGLDGAILDPLQVNDAILDAMDSESEPFGLARAVLLGEDDFGMEYITAHREGRLK